MLLSALPLNQGMSSPVVNVLWGSFNLIAGFALARAGRFGSRQLDPLLTVAIGRLLMSVMPANTFGHVFAAR